MSDRFIGHLARNSGRALPGARRSPPERAGCRMHLCHLSQAAPAAPGTPAGRQRYAGLRPLTYVTPPPAATRRGRPPPTHVQNTAPSPRRVTAKSPGAPTIGGDLDARTQSIQRAHTGRGENHPCQSGMIGTTRLGPPAPSQTAHSEATLRPRRMIRSNFLCCAEVKKISRITTLRIFIRNHRHTSESGSTQKSDN
ncbi:hypothetical protein Franean1_0119 [Parafrankia sp. EAN1pec]|nr:hypothetical protein Franean1_0119 [Frankia sp. EAN1pec]